MVVERKGCVVPQEFCPQAVIDWYNYGDENHRSEFARADVKRMAKSHLSAVGWTFWYGRKNDRWELRYTSPSGKSHYSLRMACKSCIDSGGANPDSAVFAAEDQCRSVPKKVDSFSQENIITSPINTPKSPAEPNNSNPNSATSRSPTRKQLRKRKLEFESVQCEPVKADQTPHELDDKKNLDLLQVDPASGSNPVVNTADPITRPGKVIADSKSVKETKKRIKKRRDNNNNNNGDGNNKRVKKIPNTRVGNKNSSRGRSSLAALIDSNAVTLGAKVSYRGKPSSGGAISREGIRCDCCSAVFALTAFEEHIGSTNHRPAANILLEDGRSLADCKPQITKNNPARAAAAADNSDDICGVCQYGGDLVLCDGCPSAYHPACLGFGAAPDGDWFCPSCRCGLCGGGGGGGGGDFLTCRQCERKFHTRCLGPAAAGGRRSPFCGRKCEEVFVGLRELVGKRIRVGGDGDGLVTWTVLRTGGNDPRLEAALSVMHRCFEPARDPLTNRDIVEDVFRGRRSELSRLNFGGFHVVVVEKGGEIVCVAAVRVCGGRLAEVPLVATGFEHRRMGLCRVLMEELERRMSELGVERLILPAAACVLRTWVDSFGFSEMSAGEKLEVLSYNPLDFQGTVMCQKLLVKTTMSEVKSRPLVEDLPAEAKDDELVNGYYWGCEAKSSSAISAERFMDCGLRNQGRIVDMAAKVAAV